MSGGLSALRDQLEGSTAGATVVGKISPEVFTVLIDSGWTVTVRVSSYAAGELGVGQRANLMLDPDGSLRLVPG